MALEFTTREDTSPGGTGEVAAAGLPGVIHEQRRSEYAVASPHGGRSGRPQAGIPNEPVSTGSAAGAGELEGKAGSWAESLNSSGLTEVSASNRQAAPKPASLAKLKASTVASASSRGAARLRLVTKTGIAVKAVKDEQAIRDKIFGRRRVADAADTDRFRAAAETPLIILPGTTFKKSWDVVYLLSMIWISTRVPYNAAFDDQEGGLWLVLDVFFDCFLLVDVVLRLLLAHMDDGEIVATHREVAWRYLTSWFALDLVSSLGGPLHWFAPQDSRRLHILRMLQVLRLARLDTAEAEVSLWLPLGHSVRHHLRLLKLFLAIVTVAHVGACTWVWVDHALSVTEESWMYQYGVQESTNGTKYLSALYWAYATLTSVGYGDVSAYTNEERFVSICMIVVGAMLFALTVGRLSAAAQEFNASKARMREKVLRINQFVKERNLPRHLRLRTREYYDYIVHTSQGLREEAKLLDDLSPALRRSISLHLNRVILESVPIFKFGGTGFQTLVVTKLRPVVCLQGEYVVVAGEWVSEMYFVRSGDVQVVNLDGGVVTTLEPGSFFAEQWLLDRTRATESIRCASHVSLYSLAREHMAELSEAFPEFEGTVRKVSQLRNLHNKARELRRTASTRLGASGVSLTPKSCMSGSEDLLQVPPPFGWSSWKEVRDGTDFSSYYQDLLKNNRIMQAANYNPSPANHSKVALPGCIGGPSLREFIGNSLHDLEAERRFAEGWRYGPAFRRSLKEDPRLVPFGELPDGEREAAVEMTTVRLRTLIAAGFSVERPAGSIDPVPSWRFGRMAEPSPSVGTSVDMTMSEGRVNFVPNPFPSDMVTLPASMVPVADEVARQAHESWALRLKADGWAWGVKTEQRKRIHSRLVPWDALSDPEKEPERAAARNTLLLLFAIGLNVKFAEQAIKPSGALLAASFARRKLRSLSGASDAEMRSRGPLSPPLEDRPTPSVAPSPGEDGGHALSRLEMGQEALERRVDDLEGILSSMATALARIEAHITRK